MGLLSSYYTKTKQANPYAGKPTQQSSGSAQPTSGGLLSQYNASQQQHQKVGFTSPPSQVSTTPVKVVSPVQKVQLTPGQKKIQGIKDFLDNTIGVDNRKKIGQAARSIVSVEKKLPEAHFADKMPLYSPVGFAANLAQGAINTPAQAFKGATSLGESTRDNTANAKTIAGDVASMIQLPLLFIGGGTAEKTAQTAGKGVFKTILKEGVAMGAGFGLLGGLQSGRNITSAKDYVKNLLVNVGIGGATGGLLSSATELAVPLAKGLSHEAGAVFLKMRGKTPEIEKIHLDPKAAQTMVATNNLDKKPVGKAIMKESLNAQKTEEHVAITVSDNGKYALEDGTKVDISTEPVYDPKEAKANVTSAGTAKIDPNEVKKVAGNLLKKNPEMSTADAEAMARDVIRNRPYNDANASKVPHYSEYIPEERLQKIRQVQQEAMAMEKTHTIDTPERHALRKKIVNDLYGTGAKVKEKRVDLVMGLPAAGKSSVLAEPLAKQHGSLIIDPDKVKEKLPEYKNGVGAMATHEESSYVAKGMEGNLTEKAIQNNDNIVIPTIGDNLEKMKETIAKFKQLGYDVHLHLNDVENRTSVERALLRHEKTGRYVDINYIHSLGLKPRENFAILKTEKGVSSYGKYSNEVPEGSPLKLTESSAGYKPVTADGLVGNRSNTPEPNAGQANSQTETNLSPPPKDLNSNAQSPVGQGKLRESKAYSRIVDRLDEESQLDVSYNRVNLKDQAEKALALTYKNPEQATRIALGMEKPPEGVLDRSVTLAVAERALADKDMQLYSRVEAAGSLRQTRRGQEIVVDRGRFNENSPHFFMRDLIDRRMKQLGVTYEQAVKSAQEKGKTYQQAVVDIIDSEKGKLKERIRKDRQKIKLAQDFIDQITC